MVRYIFSTSVILILIPVTGKATERNLRANGFFSTGVSWVNKDVSYAQQYTNEPSFYEETFLGLNLASTLSDEWTFAAQLLARAADADGAVKADWAFATYEPSNSFQVRLGKQKVPLWMVADFIDVGHAYPWVRPPGEVYGLFNLKSMTGIAPQLQFFWRELAFRLEVFGGESIIEGAPSAPTAKSKIHGSKHHGFAFNISKPGYEWHFGYDQADWDLSQVIDFGVRTFRVMSTGVTLKPGNYLMMAEYAQTKDLDEGEALERADALADEAAAAAAAGDTEKATELSTIAYVLKFRLGGAKAYYTTIGYLFRETFLPHLTYARLKGPDNPIKTDQDSLTLGLNYYPITAAVIKLEAKRIYIKPGNVGKVDQDPASVLMGKVAAPKHLHLYSVNFNYLF